MGLDNPCRHRHCSHRLSMEVRSWSPCASSAGSPTGSDSRRTSTDLMDELAFHREMIERDLIRRGHVARRRERAGAAHDGQRDRACARNRAQRVALAVARGALAGRDLHASRPAAQSDVHARRHAHARPRHRRERRHVLARRSPAVSPTGAHDRSGDGPSRLPVPNVAGTSSARPAGSTRGTPTSRDGRRLFSQTASFALKTLAVGTGEETRVRNIAVVSASFFGFFDAPPVLGRYFTASEDAPPHAGTGRGAESRDCGTTQFGARRDVLGSTLRNRRGRVHDHRRRARRIRRAVAVSTAGRVRPGRDVRGAARARRDWATTYGHAVWTEHHRPAKA